MSCPKVDSGTELKSIGLENSKPIAAGNNQSSYKEESESGLFAYHDKLDFHRLRRYKERSLKSFVFFHKVKSRISIINRLDFFHRYSKQEREVLSCFDFLDELVRTHCDGGLDSPRHSQKLYQSMFYELI